MLTSSVVHGCDSYATAPPFQPEANPPKAHGSTYAIVTTRIVEQLERGVVAWRRPWRSEVPTSLASLRPYRGINTLLLASQGFSSRYWLTYGHAVSLGGHIRKGEHSTLVVFWKHSPYTKHNDETGEDETRDGFLLRYYRVFNLEQTEGIAEKLGLSASPRVPDLEQCERIINGMACKPRMEWSNAAWYRPLTDTVGMPDKSLFSSSAEFYATMFHELGHATGHPSRVGREGIENVQSSASESYSKEELIAEMTSAFLCGVAGISPAVLANSAAYLQGWIRRLRGDSRLLISAASAAQKAADYILGKHATLDDDGAHA